MSKYVPPSLRNSHQPSTRPGPSPGVADPGATGTPWFKPRSNQSAWFKPKPTGPSETPGVTGPGVTGPGVIGTGVTGPGVTGPPAQTGRGKTSVKYVPPNLRSNQVHLPTNDTTTFPSLGRETNPTRPPNTPGGVEPPSSVGAAKGAWKKPIKLALAEGPTETPEIIPENVIVVKAASLINQHPIVVETNGEKEEEVVSDVDETVLPRERPPVDPAVKEAVAKAFARMRARRAAIAKMNQNQLTKLKRSESDDKIEEEASDVASNHSKSSSSSKDSYDRRIESENNRMEDWKYREEMLYGDHFHHWDHYETFRNDYIRTNFFYLRDNYTFQERHILLLDEDDFFADAEAYMEYLSETYGSADEVREMYQQNHTTGCDFKWAIDEVARKKQTEMYGF